MSHEPNLEDKYLEFIFSGKEPGICINIGSNNTNFFKTNNWKCLSYESIPQLDLDCKGNDLVINIQQNNTLDILNILKSIDIHNYSINLFVITNNNSNDKLLYQDYLVNNGYSKINTTETTDFFIKQYIPNDFKLVSAYYYINNYYEPANVIHKLLLLYSLFRVNKKHNTFSVSNELFTDTILNSVKTLYINVVIEAEKKTFEFIEGTTINWDEFINVNSNLYMLENFEDTLSTLIDVSFGEIMDRYSILEIKQKYIINNPDINQIIIEIRSLSMYNNIKHKYQFFYRILRHINEQIWLDTDIINQMDIDAKDPSDLLKFSLTSKNIFKNNRKRMRLKNYFNQFIYSSLKNTHGFINTFCYVDISDDKTIHNKIPELNYLFLEYDHLYFSLEYAGTIKKTFINPNMSFIEYKPELNIATIKLSDYTFDARFRDIYIF
jgi:hypothetical protein